MYSREVVPIWRFPMKKTGIIFIVLLAFAAILFCSCGALTNAGHGTDSFTFTIDSTLAEQIARTAGSSTITV